MGVRPRPLNPRASRYVGFKINWRRLIDEIAATVGTDPVAFHLRYLTTLCGIAVVKAVAERAGWQPRPSHNPDCSGDTLRDRGIAYAQCSGAVVAIVAGVEIDRRTGKVWARKFTVAHDCGLIINPDGGCENFRSKLFRQCEPVHRPAGWEAR